MRNLTFLLVIIVASCNGQSSGSAGMRKWYLHDLLKPTAGTLIIDDTQANPYIRNWAQEAIFFYDSADSNIKTYFTGGSDSIETAAYNNRIGLTTSTDMVTFSTPIKVIGMNNGGAPALRRATSAWVGKQNGKYYAFALNGYPTLPRTGQDANIYGYSSNDGITWVDEGIKFEKTTAWTSVLAGFGNTDICTDQYNNPLLIGGKYIALVDAWSGTAWVTYRAEADSLMGNWTLTHPAPSLQVGAITTYGSCQIIYFKGLYYSFYLYGIGASEPSKLAYAVSTNSIDWTIKEAPFMGLEAMPYGVLTDQIADVNLCEINSKVYMMAGYNQNAPTFKGQVRLWTFDGTFEQMISKL